MKRLTAIILVILTLGPVGFLHISGVGHDHPNYLIACGFGMGMMVGAGLGYLCGTQACEKN